MKIGSENIDEVLFEYFEGNLSEQDKKEVKIFLDENQEHLDDFRLWEVSNAKQYVLEEPTDRTLLKPNHSIKWKTLLYLSGDIVLMTSLFFLLQWHKPAQPDLSVKGMAGNVQVDKNKKAKTETKQNSASLLPNKIAKNEEDRVLEKLVDTLFDQAETIVQKDTIVEVIKIHHTTGLASLDTLPLDSLRIENETAATKVNMSLSKREETRKARSLEKFKQRTKDKRQQQEFMKGNKPYVVPVNPNAF